MSYKKIVPMVMALGMFTFGGLGCSKEEKFYPPVMRGNGELRQWVYNNLCDKPYSLKTDKHEIIVKAVTNKWDRFLSVTIKDRSTNDTLELRDIFIDGNLDKAEYNGMPGSIEGMEERFDRALELIKPGLEQKVKKAEEEKKSMVDRVKDNTKL